jgi:membrane fusion protein
MRDTLFRPEALANSQPSMAGAPIGARLPSFRWLTGFALVSGAAVLLLLTAGHYTRKIHVTGYLAPSAGLIKIYAGQAGTLVEKHVREGQLVRRGETLFLLSTEHGTPEMPESQAAGIATIRLRQASLRRDVLTQAEIARLQAQGLQERLRAMAQEQRQLQAALDLQRQRIEGAQRTVARFEGLAAQHFVADPQVDQKREELLDQRSRAGDIQRAQALLARDEAAVRQELATIDLKAGSERAKADRELAQLDQQLAESESRRTVAIAAPIDGIATGVLGERAQSAGAQTLLLTLLPSGSALQGKLLVPGRAIGFIAQGDAVSLRYQAFPYQAFGAFKARVTEIARTTTQPDEADAPTSPGEAAYRVTVALESQQVRTERSDVALQPGMQLEADIWLERRRLVDWLFEPLFATAKRI